VNGVAWLPDTGLGEGRLEGRESSSIDMASPRVKLTGSEANQVCNQAEASGGLLEPCPARFARLTCPREHRSIRGRYFIDGSTTWRSDAFLPRRTLPSRQMTSRMQTNVLIVGR
jgi:hypothetical protein